MQCLHMPHTTFARACRLYMGKLCDQDRTSLSTHTRASNCAHVHPPTQHVTLCRSPSTSPSTTRSRFSTRTRSPRRASGTPIGPMEGIPVATKEALNYFGKPSTWGWKYTSATTGGVYLYPLANAPLVQRLIDAGAIIIGKTNIPVRTCSAWPQHCTRSSVSQTTDCTAAPAQCLACASFKLIVPHSAATLVHTPSLPALCGTLPFI
jgi:Amidase